MIKIKLMHDDACMPERMTSGAAGFDLRAVEGGVIHAGATKAFRTGIAVEIPPGYMGLVCSRSGLAKKGVFVTNAPGVIDSDYRGEIVVLLSMVTESIFGLHRVAEGDRIAQIVIVQTPQLEICEAEHLSETRRGDAGFGSTGR